MTVLIFTKSNPIGLATLLVNLQPQLSTNDDIYVVGDSYALEIAKKYGSTRCYIFVEVGNYSFEQAIDFAWQSKEENKQEGLLVLTDKCVVSGTFIANLKRFSNQAEMLAPLTSQYPYMDQNFRWYNLGNRIEMKLIEQRDCFYLKKRSPKTHAIFPDELVMVLE